jgi:hypothetical protein
VPIGHSAEKVLVADRIVSGEFRNSEGMLVRVFSAKRHRENPNEIGLFIHTPDRCWTEGGWKLEMSVPDSLELTLHGTSIPFERRIFEIKGQRELVYFAGLVSGRGLPYRLDHHQSIATRAGLASLTQALDPHFWHRLWDSFKSRTQLQGPKHFLRISTPIEGRDLTECDEMLKGFLPQWLVSGDYYEEIHRAVVESKQRIPR